MTSVSVDQPQWDAAISDAAQRGATKAAWLLADFRPLRIGETAIGADGESYKLLTLAEARDHAEYMLTRAEFEGRSTKPHIADKFDAGTHEEFRFALWQAYEQALLDAFQAAIKTWAEIGLFDPVT